jgi:peptidoglycan/xylan/chitin deacetylase (PgdA/CDA1 family)
MMSSQAWLTTSWDDGHPLDMRLAELLHDNRLAATFYIPRKAPTGVMPESQLRELSQSFEIGGHTLDHLFLPTIPDAQAELQINGCKKWVEDTTGKACAMFCPPAGKYSDVHLAMIKKSGFRGMRSVELLSTSTPQARENLAKMPTTLQAFPHSRLAYIKNTIKRRRIFNLWRYILMGGPSGWEKLVEKLLQNVIDRGGVFHLWGHSWEIEQTSQWQALERALNLMGQFVSSAHVVTNGELCVSCSTGFQPVPRDIEACSRP